MKNHIDEIIIGDLIYSKRSNRIATVIGITSYGFQLRWNKTRFDGDSLINRYEWKDWHGIINEEYLIFNTDHEKLTAILKYSS